MIIPTEKPARPQVRLEESSVLPWKMAFSLYA
ncbi:hypothetical protein RDI58_021968 [Solanum bulbocastanum]|uniref:Uncharacterized protein n=1 Tax=Solanum bulbocastanum TaxID=147425 RepID=A0AAN8Y581_SOLBU